MLLEDGTCELPAALNSAQFPVTVHPWLLLEKSVAVIPILVALQTVSESTMEPQAVGWVRRLLCALTAGRAVLADRYLMGQQVWS